MSHCPYCGIKLKLNARFCHNCGKMVAELKEPISLKDEGKPCDVEGEYWNWIDQYEAEGVEFLKRERLKQRQITEKLLDILLKCETAQQTAEGFSEITRILKEMKDPRAYSAEMACLELRNMSDADVLEARDTFVSNLQHGLRLEGSVALEIAVYSATVEPVKASKLDIDASSLSEGGLLFHIVCPNCRAVFSSTDLLKPLRDKFAQLIAKLTEPEERDFWLGHPMVKPMSCNVCGKRFLVTVTGQDLSYKISTLEKKLHEAEAEARRLDELHNHDKNSEG